MTTPKPDGPRKRPDARPADATGEGLREGLKHLASDAPPGSGWLIGARLRNYFLTGLVVVGPVTLTLYIAWYFINVADNWVKPYIPNVYNPSTYIGREVPGVGLIFAIVALTMIGALAANLIGRSLISTGEMMVNRMPIVRNVYRALKQIFESVVTATSANDNMQKVALIEFPSKGLWSIVFVTGEAAGEIAAARPGGETDLVSVFMPTGIVPPTGFVCFVPRRDVMPLAMSAEDAAKVVISGGMVTPDGKSRTVTPAEADRLGKALLQKVAAEKAAQQSAAAPPTSGQAKRPAKLKG